jgi:hypothetical protein
MSIRNNFRTQDQKKYAKIKSRFVSSEPAFYYNLYIRPHYLFPELLTKAMCWLSGDQDGVLMVP